MTGRTPPVPPNDLRDNTFLVLTIAYGWIGVLAYALGSAILVIWT